MSLSELHVGLREDARIVRTINTRPIDVVDADRAAMVPSAADG